MGTNTPSDMRSDFQRVIDEHGTTITMTKHLVVYSGTYNESYYKTGSDTTTSGLAIFIPIGPSDAQVLPQGQASLYPRTMYVHGSTDLTADTHVRDGTGSLYEVIPGMGIMDYVVSGTVIYRKAHVRAMLGSDLEYA